ncbi:hypothetical protein E4U45_006236, partial [Claviceps purpurea]
MASRHAGGAASSHNKMNRRRLKRRVIPTGRVLRMFCRHLQRTNSPQFFSVVGSYPSHISTISSDAYFNRRLAEKCRQVRKVTEAILTRTYHHSTAYSHSPKTIGTSERRIFGSGTGDGNILA